MSVSPRGDLPWRGDGSGGKAHEVERYTGKGLPGALGRARSQVSVTLTVVFSSAALVGALLSQRELSIAELIAWERYAFVGSVIVPLASCSW